MGSGVKYAQGKANPNTPAPSSGFAGQSLVGGLFSNAMSQSKATAKPAMRSAPLDLSDTGRPPLNLKNKKALNPSLQAPMTLYDRQMLKGK